MKNGLLKWLPLALAMIAAIAAFYTLRAQVDSNYVESKTDRAAIREAIRQHENSQGDQLEYIDKRLDRIENRQERMLEILNDKVSHSKK